MIRNLKALEKKLIRLEKEKIDGSVYDDMALELTCMSLTEEQLRQTIKEYELEERREMYQYIQEKQCDFKSYLLKERIPYTQDRSILQEIIKNFK